MHWGKVISNVEPVRVGDPQLLNFDIFPQKNRNTTDRRTKQLLSHTLCKIRNGIARPFMRSRPHNIHTSKVFESRGSDIRITELRLGNKEVSLKPDKIWRSMWPAFAGELYIRGPFECHGEYVFCDDIFACEGSRWVVRFVDNGWGVRFYCCWVVGKIAGDDRKFEILGGWICWFGYRFG